VTRRHEARKKLNRQGAMTQRKIVKRKYSKIFCLATLRLCGEILL